MSSPSKVHDPLFHYETHFPERLSRLHVGSEFGPAGSFKKSRKTRQRIGIRYKTQPVTFDEITEVDEEPEDKGDAGSAEGAARPGRGLMGQFQAFSRSMDGLLPRIPEQSVQPSLSGPAHRHHVERPPSIPSIPELVESTSKSPVIPVGPSCASASAVFSASVSLPCASRDRLQPQPAADTAPAPDTQGHTSVPVHRSGEEGAGPAAQAIPSPSVGTRRQKVTAKAKKRQKAAEEQAAKDM